MRKEHVLAFIEVQILLLEKEKAKLVDFIQSTPYQKIIDLRKQMERDIELANRNKQHSKFLSITQAFNKEKSKQLKIAEKQGNFQALHAELHRIDSVLSWLHERKYLESNR